MKIEINNKQLEKQLEEIAQNKYITVELLISEILKEYVEDTSGFEIDNSVEGVRQEADKICKEIDTKLKLFENRFDVKASIELNTYPLGQITPQRYNIKVVL